MERGGYVYIMTNRPDGTICVGVTANLARRAWEHREGAIDGFTKRYRLKRLVWFERHDDIVAAIQREKTMKHWSRPSDRSIPTGATCSTKSRDGMPGSSPGMTVLLFRHPRA